MKINKEYKKECLKYGVTTKKKEKSSLSKSQIPTEDTKQETPLRYFSLSVNFTSTTRYQYTSQTDHKSYFESNI